MTGEIVFFHSKKARFEPTQPGQPQNEFYSPVVNSGKVAKQKEAISPKFTQ